MKIEMIARNHYDDETLNRLLDRRAECDSEVARHVEFCEACQERLETLSQDGMTWNEVGELLLPDEVSPLLDSGEPADDAPERLRLSAKTFLDPTDHPDSLGRFARYEIMELLGRGGMGIVMRGYDTQLNRNSAIKVLAPELASSAAARKRFSREAKSAAAVVHPHVVPIQTVDEHNGLPYLVMPVVEGQSLQHRVEQQGPLRIIEAVRIAGQVAEGLSAAHEQGLVHRDIKPANVLLENGVERVQITDFGLARAIDDASMTRSGVIAGTPQYMSPEQAHGDAIDLRSDLFSLGSLIYFMLAGRSPFRAETTMGVLNRIGNDQPRSIRSVNADVPQWLEQIVMKLLSKTPDDRYQTAGEVAQLLQRWHAHLQQPDVVNPPKQPDRLIVARPKLAATSNAMNFSLAKPWLLAIATATFLALTGVAFVLEMNKGTLTIQCDADNVPIRIVQGDHVVKQMTVSQTGESTRIAAGNYVVEVGVGFDGVVVQGGNVSLKRGTTEIVKITLEETVEAKAIAYRLDDLIDKTAAQPTETQLDFIADLIRRRIAPESWMTEAFEIECYPSRSSLVIHQTQSVHQAIEQLLNDLRERHQSVNDEMRSIVERARSEVMVEITNLELEIYNTEAETGSEPPTDASLLNLAGQLRSRLTRAKSLLESLDKQAGKVAGDDKTDAQIESTAALPTYSGKDIREWFAMHRQQMQDPLMQDYGPQHPSEIFRAIKVLVEHPNNDDFVVAEIQTRFDFVKNELNPQALDRAAETIVALAGQRHQDVAIEYLFKIADLRPMPQNTGELEWFGDKSERGKPYPFRNAIASIARWDRALAEQLLLEMNTSSRRILGCWMILQPTDIDVDEDAEKRLDRWLRENATILLSAAVAGLDDPNAVTRYYSVTLAMVARTSSEPSATPIKTTQPTALSIDEALKQRIDKLLRTETDVYVMSVALNLMAFIDPANQTLRNTHIAWARSIEKGKAWIAMNSMDNRPAGSVSTLIELLEDHSWTGAANETYQGFGPELTNARSLAIAILGRAGKNAEPALEILVEELMSEIPECRQQARVAINAIQATLGNGGTVDEEEQASLLNWRWGLDNDLSPATIHAEVLQLTEKINGLDR